MDSDLISRSDLLTRMCQENCGERQCVDAMDRCVWYNYIKQQPTVDAVEVVHGEWIRHGYKWRCSKCDEKINVDGTPYENGLYYCPNCGAKMDGGDE